MEDFSNNLPNESIDFDKEGNDPIRESFEEYQNLFQIPIEDLENKSVLDVGTYHGEFIRYLREVLHNEKSFGVERDKLKVPNDAPEWFIVSDGLSLPFQDNSFDVVTAKHFVPLFYVKEGTLVMEELIRVLKPHGTLYFNGSTPKDVEYNELQLKQILGEKYDEKSEFWKVLRETGALRHELFIHDLDQKGFHIVKEKNDNGIVYKISKP